MKSSPDSEAASWKKLALSQKVKNKLPMSTIDKYNNLQITSPAVITEFFKYLIFERYVNVHPDTPFEDYVGQDSVSTFTPEEASILNAFMEACFIYCKKNQLDIYEIGLNVFNEFLKS